MSTTNTIIINGSVKEIEITNDYIIIDQGGKILLNDSKTTITINGSVKNVNIEGQIISSPIED